MKRLPVQLSKRDGFRVFMLGLIWLVLATAVRPLVSHLECGNQPELCPKSSIPWPDRLGVDFADARADHHSYTTQNLSPLASLLVPATYLGVGAWMGRLTPHGAFVQLGIQAVLIVEAAMTNGVAMETTRLLVQRPRPPVYRTPTTEGLSPENYTSFYSGHTSFSAVCAALGVLSLVSLGASWPWIAASGLLGGGLVAATAALRVLGGRHFMTDVVAGALAGILIAFWVYRSHVLRTGRRRVRT